MCNICHFMTLSEDHYVAIVGNLWPLQHINVHFNMIYIKYHIANRNTLGVVKCILMHFINTFICNLTTANVLHQLAFTSKRIFNLLLTWASLTKFTSDDCGMKSVAIVALVPFEIPLHNAYRYVIKMTFHSFSTRQSFLFIFWPACVWVVMINEMKYD